MLKDMLLSVYALVACVIVLFWLYSRSTFDYWRKRNVFFFKPLPYIGNFAPILLVRLSMHEFFDKMYRQLDNLPYGGFFEMRTPVLLVKDPELITHILTTDFKHFTDRGFDFLYPNRKLNPINVNIFNAAGQRWKMLRQKMTPIFTTGKLKTMQEQLICCTSMLFDHLEATGEDVNLKDAFDRFAIDVIGMCAFGLECNSTKSNDQFRDMGYELFKPSFRKSLPWLCRTISTKLLEWFNLPDFPNYVTNFYSNLLLDTVLYRRQNNVVRNDFLQLLMDLQNDAVDPKYAPDGNKSNLTSDSFDEIDIVANAFLIFAGGFESTAITLSFCVYELAVNKNIQEKLRDEVLQVRAKYDDKKSYECYQGMTYMEQVILETTRKYPPFPVLYRKCEDDYIMPKTGLKLQRGDKINIPAWSVHHDWKYYPNPELFDPDRFTPEKKESRPAGTFLSFGEGPRFCMGKRFVIFEIKIVLSELLLKYDFVPSCKTEMPVVMMKAPFSTVAEDGPWIKLINRSNLIYEESYQDNVQSK